jgi:hypothetical protein
MQFVVRHLGRGEGTRISLSSATCVTHTPVGVSFIYPSFFVLNLQGLARRLFRTRTIMPSYVNRTQIRWI